LRGQIPPAQPSRPDFAEIFESKIGSPGISLLNPNV